MSPKFTPGPWGAIGRAVFSGDIFVGLASHPRDIEETPNGKFPATYDESLANARLYAAAPSMYDLLCELASAFESLELWSGVKDDCKAALKARALISRIDGATP